MSPAVPRVEGPFVFYSEELRAVLGDDPQLVELAIQGPGTYYMNLPHHIRTFDAAGRRR